MSAQTDLDTRIAALQQEYQNLIATTATRAAMLASELAACQTKLTAVEAQLKEAAETYLKEKPMTQELA